MQEIIEILSDMKPGVDFAEQHNMIEDGILTSMDVLMLVSALEEEFDVEIGLKEVIHRISALPKQSSILYRDCRKMTDTLCDKVTVAVYEK